MNLRTEQTRVENDAAGEIMRQFRAVNRAKSMPEPMPPIWRITFAGALAMLLAPVVFTLGWIVTP